MRQSRLAGASNRPARSPSAFTAIGVPENPATAFFAGFGIEILHSVGGVTPHHRSPTSAIEPAGQDLAKPPSFDDALVVGKKEADARMARSLYQRGVGYDYDAVKIFMPAGAKKPIYAPYVEHVPARRDSIDLLAEEPRPGSLARRLAARARHRQVRDLR
jgi:hypothetical protein